MAPPKYGIGGLLLGLVTGGVSTYVIGQKKLKKERVMFEKVLEEERHHMNAELQKKVTEVKTTLANLEKVHEKLKKVQSMTAAQKQKLDEKVAGLNKKLLETKLGVVGLVKRSSTAQLNNFKQTAAYKQCVKATNNVSHFLAGSLESVQKSAKSAHHKVTHQYSALTRRNRKGKKSGGTRKRRGYSGRRTRK